MSDISNEPIVTTGTSLKFDHFPLEAICFYTPGQEDEITVVPVNNRQLTAPINGHLVGIIGQGKCYGWNTLANDISEGLEAKSKLEGAATYTQLNLPQLIFRVRGNEYDWSDTQHPVSIEGDDPRVIEPLALTMKGSAPLIFVHADQPLEKEVAQAIKSAAHYSSPTIDDCMDYSGELPTVNLFALRQLLSISSPGAISWEDATNAMATIGLSAKNPRVEATIMQIASQDEEPALDAINGILLQVIDLVEKTPVKSKAAPKRPAKEEKVTASEIPSAKTAVEAKLPPKATSPFRPNDLIRTNDENSEIQGLVPGLATALYFVLSEKAESGFIGTIMKRAKNATTQEPVLRLTLLTEDGQVNDRCRQFMAEVKADGLLTPFEDNYTVKWNIAASSEAPSLIGSSGKMNKNISLIVYPASKAEALWPAQLSR